ncbi:hypothetical protein [Flammeovirga agarivorans]|uniref:Uncharacterized protein n=1 Tax=Flammeovirga agarivorans TaxID=2726742 RepID=A0A7X8SR74_9BACT|nr:hypothetical protein [Flammeovirga agarivorans]NLR94851.1 hypothetical protein [Flammeovirga agarivorans]
MIKIQLPNLPHYTNYFELDLPKPVKSVAGGNKHVKLLQLSPTKIAFIANYKIFKEAKGFACIKGDKLQVFQEYTVPKIFEHDTIVYGIDLI